MSSKNDFNNEFVDKIIFEVKAQGHFDAFRRECLADVDTQPAYQNLHSRVEDTVQRFLNRQIWTPETNRTRLREDMRNNIIRAGFLDTGVTRIVDQVVEQKMDYIQSKVEEILYKYVGIEKPIKTEEENELKVDTALLPTDLEQVSPDSDKKSLGSTEIKEETEMIMDEDEDFESPAFEPIKPEKSENSNLSEISGLTIEDSNKSPKEEKAEVKLEPDTQLSQISSTQDNIADSNLQLTRDLPPLQCDAEAPVINGEEAQMATGLNDASETDIRKEFSSNEPEKSQFDLNKDVINFTGTERGKALNYEEPIEEKTPPPPGTEDEPEITFDNYTTDSSEIKMEIDLKNSESTQETTGNSSTKMEESSQDSSKGRHKRERGSRDRSKSSHKSSRHHHSSSSSKSKHSDKHRSGKSNSSSHNKKSSSDKKESRHKDKDRKSHSSKSRKGEDDHFQEKLSQRKRRSTDSRDGKGDGSPSRAPESGNEKVQRASGSTKSQNKPESSAEKLQDATESKLVIVDQILNQNREISIDSPSRSKETKTTLKSEDEMEFSGFGPNEEAPNNPWLNALKFVQSENFSANNNYLDKKKDGSMSLNISKKSKSKSKNLNSPDTEESSEINLNEQKSTDQQRYNTSDLYKPKFDFRSRRRTQITEEKTDDAKESTSN